MLWVTPFAFGEFAQSADHSDGICKLIHNRDKNAVQNMISIIEELKKIGKRPLRFTREVVEAN